ncbi:MAG: hypothetical protein PHR28_07510 [candidate division Zixibacteria bacterium]|nr:hypothetical protein [candidate division Zixibacteria bacterium]
MNETRLRETIRAGAEYILSRQHHDGYWEDFNLPPGRADMWVTAYVGLKLKSILDRFDVPDFRGALVKAAAWIDRTKTADGGWGYNRSCPTDADSTAHALLFLHRMSYAVSPEYRTVLTGFLRPDGGVSTYRPSCEKDAWGVSHPDVTAMVGIVLRELFPDRDDALSRIVTYLRDNRGEDGLWNSYWWNTPLYATALTLDFMKMTNAAVDAAALRDTLSAGRPKHAFHKALDIRCRRMVSMPPDRLAAELVGMQEDDGSWMSVPMLRLTYSNMAEPWLVEDGGRLFADDDRLFTTATVVASLSEALTIANV